MTQLLQRARKVVRALALGCTVAAVVRVLYDESNLYIGVFCRDTMGAAGVRVQDLRRKFDYYTNDLFGISIDPFHDGRNVAAFQITPYGAQRELQVYDDLVFNREWEAVWRTRAVISDSGWTAEIAIPWSTLRYKTDGLPWNMNFYRIARRTNETSAWIPWNRAFTAYRANYFGQLGGLLPPPPKTSIRVRPYVLAQSDRQGANPATFGSGAAQTGGDLTWNPQSNSALDLTVNTDFAQTDVDRQVVNTTRFSVFFPERRQFFLESASLFSIGPEGFVIKPFFSRRIGLDNGGNVVPLSGGARYVRRDVDGSDGLLLMQQHAYGDVGSSTFGVARTSRNVGSAGRIGGLVATRFDNAGRIQFAGTDSVRRMASSQTLVSAIDGFTRNGPLQLDGMLSAQTASGGRDAGLAAYAGTSYQNGTLSTGLNLYYVSRDYNPPTGFVSRSNVIVTHPSASYDWRPSWRPSFIRRFVPFLGVTTYNLASDRSLDETFSETYVDIAFSNGALIYPDLQHTYQRLTSAFSPVRGVAIKPGNYSNIRGVFYGQTDGSAKASASMNLSSGGYYDRLLDQWNFAARYAPTPFVAFAAAYEFDRFRGRDSTVVTHLMSPEMRLAINPRLLLTTFYQYNTSAARGALNARASWEFAPLSYVYLVINDLRAAGPDARAIGPAYPAQRVALKFVWLGQL